MGDEEVKKRRVYIGTSISEVELEEAIDGDLFALVKMTVGMRGIFFSGLLRKLEERLEYCDEPEKQRKLQDNIQKIKSLL